MGIVCCPACGHQKPVKPIPRGARFRCGNCGCREILILTRGKGTEKPGVPLQEAMRQTLAGLMRIADYRGFKPGWVYHKFRSIFGTAPKGVKTEAEPATAELRLWIKRQARAWAKAKRATERPITFTDPEPLEAGPDGFVAGTLLRPEDFDVRW